MEASRLRLGTLALVGVGLGAALMGSLWLRERLGGRGMMEGGRRVVAATQAATPGAARGGVEVSAPPTYMELVRRVYANYPATQPMEEPVGLAFAGHIALSERAYLDNTGRLWITRAGAGDTEGVLSKAGEEEVILTRERPVYVHWMSVEKGERAYLVCRKEGGEGYELVSEEGRQPMVGGGAYDWERARSWEDKIVVPTRTGVTVFGVGKRVVESASPALCEAGGKHGPVQITFSGVGPMGWIPPDGGDVGSEGAVQYVGGGWRRLRDEVSWPAGLVHLIPLLDGSVLQLLSDEGDAVRLNVVPLDAMGEGEEKKITELVMQLSDPDGERREKAYEELTRYGPGLWAVAEKVMDSEPAETRARLKDLLRSKVSPLLGGMELVDGRLRVVSRYRDGGVLFHAERGVSIPRGENEPVVISPAWLVALPGESIRLLPQDLVRGLEVGKARLEPHGPEWIVTDEERGPRRYIGGELVPLLRKDERGYGEFMGIGRGGRFVLRRGSRSLAATVPATVAGVAGEAAWRGGGVLIVDPRLVDPTPRMPVWKLEYPNARVGWDKNNWPGAKQKDGWVLGAREWRVLGESEPLYSRSEEVGAWRGGLRGRVATTGPATIPATGPWDSEGKVLLVDGEGTCYYGGQAGLKLIRKDGSRVEWRLPEEARGDGEVHLVRTGEGVLFLINRPGRVLRIRPRGVGEGEPFELEATFTRGIPRAEHLERVWVDPFGRICMAYEGSKLALLFPRGYIPTGVLNLMTVEDQKEAVEE